jgi:hypothetical protein
MQAIQLIKLLFKEYWKNICFSLLLLVIVDFIYFTGSGPDSVNKNIIMWLGGDEYEMPLIMITLKLLNISIILLTVGKIIEKLTSDIILYIMVRTTDYKRFIINFSIVSIFLGCIMVIASHLIYYSFIGIPPMYVQDILEYLLLECLGISGILLIYIILNNVIITEKGILLIMGMYALNTVLPFPVILASTTMSFIDLVSKMGFGMLLIITVILDLAILATYYILISRRRVNIC